MGSWRTCRRAPCARLRDSVWPVCATKLRADRVSGSECRGLRAPGRGGADSTRGSPPYRSRSGSVPDRSVQWKRRLSEHQQQLEQRAIGLCQIVEFLRGQIVERALRVLHQLVVERLQLRHAARVALRVSLRPGAERPALFDQRLERREAVGQARGFRFLPGQLSSPAS